MEVTISTILTDIASVVSAAITWLGSFATAITANPIIEIFVITAFVGLGVGLLARLIRL